jgi:hypothetical protein
MRCAAVKRGSALCALWRPSRGAMRMHFFIRRHNYYVWHHELIFTYTLGEPMYFRWNRKIGCPCSPCAQNPVRVCTGCARGARAAGVSSAANGAATWSIGNAGHTRYSRLVVQCAPHLACMCDWVHIPGRIMRVSLASATAGRLLWIVQAGCASLGGARCLLDRHANYSKCYCPWRSSSGTGTKCVRK